MWRRQPNRGSGSVLFTGATVDERTISNSAGESCISANPDSGATSVDPLETTNDASRTAPGSRTRPADANVRHDHIRWSAVWTGTLTTLHGRVAPGHGAGHAASTHEVASRCPVGVSPGAVRGRRGNARRSRGVTRHTRVVSLAAPTRPARSVTGGQYRGPLRKRADERDGCRLAGIRPRTSRGNPAIHRPAHGRRQDLS
jgi:hypothetical protein